MSKVKPTKEAKEAKDNMIMSRTLKTVDVVSSIIKEDFSKYYSNVMLNTRGKIGIYREHLQYLQELSIRNMVKNIIKDGCYLYESVYTENKEKSQRMRLFNTPFLKDFGVNIGIKSVDIAMSLIYDINNEEKKNFLSKKVYSKLSTDDYYFLFKYISEIYKYKNSIDVGQQDLIKHLENFPLNGFLTFSQPVSDNEIAILKKVVEKYSYFWRWRHHKGLFLSAWSSSYRYLIEKSNMLSDVDENTLNNMSNALNIFYNLYCDNEPHMLKALIDFFNLPHFKEDALNRFREIILNTCKDRKVSDRQEMDDTWRKLLDVVLLISATYTEIVNKPPIDRSTSEKTFSDYYLKSNIQDVVGRVSVFRRDSLGITG